MKTLLLLVVFFCSNAMAQTTMYPTYPGTTLRDYSKPGIVVDRDGVGHQTYPNTTARDLSAPQYIQDNQGFKGFDGFPGFAISGEQKRQR